MYIYIERRALTCAYIHTRIHTHNKPSFYGYASTKSRNYEATMLNNYEDEFTFNQLYIYIYIYMYLHIYLCVYI